MNRISYEQRVYTTDLDETLRGDANKRLIQLAKKTNKLSRFQFTKVLSLLILNKFKLISFESFVRGITSLYGQVLQGNEESYAYDLYRQIATEESMQYEGAVDFINTLTRMGIQVVCTTGSDTRFGEIFFEENGCNMDSITVLGTDYEFDTINGIYTGKTTRSHVTQQERSQALSLESLSNLIGPSVQVIGWGGNHIADLPGFMGDKPLKIIGQDSQELQKALRQSGFNIFRDIEAYLEHPNDRRALYIGPDGASYSSLNQGTLEVLLS